MLNKNQNVKFVVKKLKLRFSNIKVQESTPTVVQ